MMHGSLTSPTVLVVVNNGMLVVRVAATASVPAGQTDPSETILIRLIAVLNVISIPGICLGAQCT